MSGARCRWTDMDRQTILAWCDFFSTQGESVDVEESGANSIVINRRLRIRFDEKGEIVSIYNYKKRKRFYAK